jgi:hypothetical protein
MNGGQIKAAVDSGQFMPVVKESNGEDNSWKYSNLFFSEDGQWWMVYWQEHRSRDNREWGLMFDLYPVVRHVETVEKVSWVMEK